MLSDTMEHVARKEAFTSPFRELTLPGSHHLHVSCGGFRDQTGHDLDHLDPSAIDMICCKGWHITLQTQDDLYHIIEHIDNIDLSL